MKQPLNAAAPASGLSESNAGLGCEPAADIEFMRHMEWEKTELSIERARFEVAFKQHKRSRKPNGKYEYAFVQHAFEGWCARAFAEWNLPKQL